MYQNNSFTILFLFTTLSILLFCIPTQATCPMGDGLECSGYGSCKNNKCDCFYGHDDTPNCDVDFPLPKLTPIRVVRSLFAVYAFGLLLITASGLISSFFVQRDERTQTLFNIKKFVLLVLIVLFIVEILHWAIDPYGYEEILHPSAHSFLANFPSTLLTAAIISILFHWIDIYNTAIHSLKREEMLSKINKNYESAGVSVDEILRKVSFLQKLKIPFIIGFLLLLAVQIANDSLYRIYPRAEQIANTIYGVLLILIWVTAAIGFLVYGKKLIRLMPGEFSGNLKRATRKINICCILELIILAFDITYYSIGKKGALLFVWHAIGLQVLRFILETILVFILIKRTKQLWCIGVMSSETGNAPSMETKSAQNSQSVTEISTVVHSV